MMMCLARSGGGRARSGVVRSVRGAEEKIVALIWFDLSRNGLSRFDGQGLTEENERNEEKPLEHFRNP
jgi:hypothetical protein